MADRPQPEWRQAVDRHSTLFDPVITVQQLPRLGFSRRSHSHIDHALVFVTASGEYCTYRPPERPTRREAASRRFIAVYEVDMGVHPARAMMKLPSSNDALEFDAEFHLTWRVERPDAFVASGHRNVPRLLLDEIQHIVRTESRRFDITKSAEAEEELRNVLGMHAPFGKDAGVASDVRLLLRRDKENIEHEKRLQALAHTSVEKIRKAESDIELQELDRQKADFYRTWLEEQGTAAWALQVVRNPESLATVIEKVEALRSQHLQRQYDLAGRLLDDGKVENHELEEPLRYAITFMRYLFTGDWPVPPPQAPTGPPPLAGAPAHDEGPEPPEKTL